MSSPGNDGELLLAAESFICHAIEFEHLFVVAADDQQGGSFHMRKGCAGQIRTSSARDDRSYIIRALSRRHQCGRGACTCSEVAELVILGLWILCKPISCANEPAGQQAD